ncbi:MAG: hypothetical protein EXX96DRAFT_242270 [Benjaminiella poitrasii]|nr:MAG: hypothetical protein EXX96DRAFT_242270 [Benjaminiella poitrasii]
MLRLLTSQDKPSVASYWEKLKEFCTEKDAEVVTKKKYADIITSGVDAGGYFKHVYFTEDHTVVQVFQRSTTSQRVTEIACLLKLRDKEHIGRIMEIIHDDYEIEVIGLTMEKYDMTLRQYISKHSKLRLSAYQRMDIIMQMLQSIRSAHQMGIAHRDLSTVNFMINTQSESNRVLEDGSTGVDLFLIDFGKATFFFPDDAQKWWVNTNEQNVYKDEMKPKTQEELTIWCKNLPYIMARPDHGYRFYRSIQTLPRTQKDHSILPYLIHPAAEDIYSLGTLVWKIFSGMEPWPGVFDTDLKKLRETVCDDYVIDNLLEREMPGPMSKKFLQHFLRVRPEDRMTAAGILIWLEQPTVNAALLEEWNVQENRSLTKARVEPVAHSRTPTPAPVLIPAAPASVKSNTSVVAEPAPRRSSRKRVKVDLEFPTPVVVKKQRTRGRPRKIVAENPVVPSKPRKSNVQIKPGGVTSELKSDINRKRRGRPKGSRNKVKLKGAHTQPKITEKYIADGSSKPDKRTDSFEPDEYQSLMTEEVENSVDTQDAGSTHDSNSNSSKEGSRETTSTEDAKEPMQEHDIYEDYAYGHDYSPVDELSETKEAIKVTNTIKTVETMEGIEAVEMSETVETIEMVEVIDKEAVDTHDANPDTGMEECDELVSSASSVSMSIEEIEQNTGKDSVDKRIGNEPNVDDHNYDLDTSPTSPKPSIYSASETLPIDISEESLIEQKTDESHKKSEASETTPVESSENIPVDNKLLTAEEYSEDRQTTPVPETIIVQNDSPEIDDKKAKKATKPAKKRRRANKSKAKSSEVDTNTDNENTKTTKVPEVNDLETNIDTKSKKTKTRTRKNSSKPKAEKNSDTSKDPRKLDGPTIIRIPNFNLLLQ